MAKKFSNSLIQREKNMAALTDVILNAKVHFQTFSLSLGYKYPINRMHLTY